MNKIRLNIFLFLSFIGTCNVISQDFTFINETNIEVPNIDFVNYKNFQKKSYLTLNSNLILSHSKKMLKGRIYGDIKLAQKGFFSKNDLTDRESFNNKYSFELIELYYKKYVDDWLFSIGRKKIKFGVGYFFSPTDIISEPTTFDDPQDRLFSINGNELFEVTYTGSNYQFDFYYLPDTEQNTKSIMQNHSFALRYYQAFDAFDYNIISRVDLDRVYQIGANGTLVIGNKTEIHFDGMFQSESTAIYPKEETSQFQKKEDKVLRILVGGQWTPSENYSLALEYIYLTEGYNKQEWSTLESIVNFGRDNFENSNTVLAEQAEQTLGVIENNAFFPARKNYLFFRFGKTELLKNIDIDIVSILELEKINTLNRVGLSYNRKNIKLYSQFQLAGISKNTSFQLLNHRQTIRFGLVYKQDF